MKILTNKTISSFITQLSNKSLSPKESLFQINSALSFVHWLSSVGRISENDSIRYRSELHKAKGSFITPKAPSLAFPLKYVGFSLAVLSLMLIGTGVYLRFYKNAKTPLAYSTAPVQAGRIISFQGRLTDTLGNPITAPIDITYNFYTAPTGGSPITNSTRICTAGPDQDGIFNSLIGNDVGGSGGTLCNVEIPTSVFTENTNVYLGVTIGSEITEMTPRQQIANVGYAINSETLQGMPPGQNVSNVPFINKDGNLLIAASNPGLRSTYASANFTISSAQATTIQSAGSGDITLSATEGGSLRFKAYNGSLLERMTVLNTGNVGIGNTNPQALLDVGGNATLSGSLVAGGQIKLGEFGSAPTTYGDGSMYYDTSTNKVYFWNGSAWTDMGAGATQYFQRTLGSLAPTNITDDLNIGAIATTSAMVHLPGLTNKDAFFNLGTGKLGVGDMSPLSLFTVGNGDLFQIDSTGRIVSIDGVAHTIDDVSSNLTLTSASSTISLNDNVTFAGTTTLNGLAYTWPGSQTTNYMLQTDGSGGLSWADPVGAAASGIFWTQTDGALYPKNSTVDAFIGGSATTSAKFAFLNVNSGTPTASVSAGVAGATFLTADGNLSTTARQSLTLGNSATYNTTGNVLLNPNGTGNVGIGTTGPGAKLEVNGTIIGRDTFSLKAGPGNNYVAATWYNTDDGVLGVLSGGANKVYLNSNGDSYFNGGNVGIGTTGPQSWAKLEVAGNVYLNSGHLYMNNGYQSGRWGDSSTYIQGSGNTSSGYLNLTVNSISGAYIDGTGNVGIGTTAPAAKLDVLGNLNVSTYATVSASLALGTSNAAAGPGHLDMSGNLTIAGAIKPGGAAGISGYLLTSSGGGVNTWADPTSLGGVWQRTLGSLAPLNITDDVNIGAIATGSAMVHLPGLANKNAFFNLGTGIVGIGTSAPTLGKLQIVGGTIIVDGGSGLDTAAAGILTLGNTTATTVNMGNTAATAIGIGAGGALGRAIDIGTGTGIDTINIGTGITGVDVIRIGQAAADLALTDAQWSISNIGAFAGVTGAFTTSITTPRITGLTTNGVVFVSGGIGTLNSEQYLATARGGLGADMTAAGIGELPYSSGTTTYGHLAAGTNNYILKAGGVGVAPSWTDPASIGLVNYWQRTLGSLAPINITDDVNIGAIATGSAMVHLPGLTNKNAFFNLGTGIVGIGTSAPTLGKLQVVGGTIIVDTTYGLDTSTGGTLALGDATAAIINVGTSALARTITLGNSTTTTGLALNSGTGDIILTSTDQIKLNSSKAATGGTTEVFAIKSTIDLGATDELLQIGDSGADMLTILGNGNVGIGITNPAAKLDILGNLNVSSYATVSASLALGTSSAAAGPGNLDMSGVLTFLGALKPGGSAGTSGQFLISSGPVGAPTWTSTVPATSLKWNALTNPDGNLALTMGAYTSTFTYNGTTGAGVNLFNLTDTNGNTGTGNLMNLTTGTTSALHPLHVAAAGVEALLVDTNGRVGIGTTGPGAKLHVAGTAYISGDVAVASMSAIPSTYNNTNILPNPSFEVATATSYDGWLIAAAGGTGTRTTTDNHDGAYGMNLAVTTPVTGQAYVYSSNRQPVSPSSTYTLSTWAKVDTACGDGFYLRAYWRDQWGNYISVSDPYSNSGAVTTSWALYKGNVTSPANAYSVSVYVFNYMPTNACSMSVDQVSFRQMIDGDVLVNGNVGIGTTGPDRKLDILDASNPQLRLTQADGTVYSDFQMNSSGDLVMNVDGVSNQLVLDNGGNVGIGTIAPAEKFTVSYADTSTTPWSASNLGIGIKNTDSTNNTWSTLGFTGANNIAAGIGTQITNQASSYGDIAFFNRSASGWSEKMRILSTGNVGIGTTAPGSLLAVVGSASVQPYVTIKPVLGATGGFNRARLGLYNQAASNTGWDVVEYGDGADALTFESMAAGVSTERMRITSTGNVGIGITAPAAKLDIVGNLNVSTYATVSASLALGTSSAAAGPGHLNMSGNLTVGTAYIAGTNGSGGNGYLLTSSAGGVNTWTDPSTLGSGFNLWQQTLGSLAPLDITDDINVGAVATGSAMVHLPGLTNKNAFFNLGTGIVGIGTSAPTLGKLQVVGGNIIVDTTYGIDTSTAGTLSLGDTTANAINMGTSALARTIIAGNSTGATSIALNTGTGSSLNLGTNAIAHTVSIGNTTGASALTLDAGTGAINMGTTIAKTITLGNATTTTALALNSGSGDIVLTSTDQIKLNSSKAAGGTTTEALSLKSTVDLGVADELLQIGDSALDMLTILGNGNVGIGTTGPVAKLQVSSTDATNPVGYLYNYAAAGSSRGLVLEAGGNSSDYSADFRNRTGTSLVYIRGDGNVGIGTTGPTAKLGLDGSISLEGATTNATKGIYWYSGGDIAWGAITRNASTGVLQVDSQTNYPISLNGLNTGGNVGIGTTAPASKLDIGSGTDYTNTNATYQFYSASKILVRDASQSVLNLISDIDTNNGVVGAIAFSRSLGQADAHRNIAGIRAIQETTGVIAGGQLEFWTKPNGGGATSARMVIDNGGNVGIGNTSPLEKLDVTGNASVSGYLTIGQAGALRSQYGPLNLAYKSNLNTWTTGLKLDDITGNVGIGTTGPATDKLQVVGGNIIVGATYGLDTATAGTLELGDNTANAINMGTSALARTIAIGNSTGTTSIALNTGTGSSLNLGTNAIAHTVTLGNVTGATAVNINSGTGGTRFTGIVGMGVAPVSGVDLSVNNNIRAARYEDSAAATYYISPGTDAWFNGNFGVDAVTSKISFWDNNGSGLPGATEYAKILADSSGVLHLRGSAAAGTGDICVGDTIADTTCAGKVDAGTIDPPYTINGKRYATYVASMTGVKEETTGQIALTTKSRTVNGYEYTIDFNTQEDGSDLWLFAKTTALRNRLNRMTVLMSPSDNARTWYKIDNQRHTLTLYASRPTTISYRLTAPRFDDEKWKNITPNGAAGFQVNDPDIASLNDIQVDGNGNIAGQIIASAGSDSGYQVLDELGNVVEETVLQAKTISAHIVAGLISAQKIVSPLAEIDTLNVSNKITSPLVETNEIKPVNNDLVINLNTVGARRDAPVQENAGALAQLIIKGLNNKPVATIDAEGNATFSGNLASQSLTTETVYTEDMNARSATISGTLIAKNIQSDNINTIESNVASLSSILASNTSQFTKNINSVQQELASLKNQPLPNPAYYQNIDASYSNLTVNDTANIYKAHIADSLVVGTLFIQPSSILALSEDLRISSLGTIRLFDDAVVIAKNGDMAIKGGMSATSLAIKNVDGVTVASIDASGSAKFNEVIARKFTLENIATQGALIADSGMRDDLNGIIPAIKTNAEVAGTGTLPQDTKEVIIYNDNVTANSLIYLTPITDNIQGQLSVTKKITCAIDSSRGLINQTPTGCTPYFIVSSNNAIHSASAFNWLIIN